MLSIKRSNCFDPPLGVYAVKLRLKSRVLSETEVYDVVHSVTIVGPDLTAAGTLSNNCVMLRYPPDDPEVPEEPLVPEDPSDPEVPEVPDEPLVPAIPEVPLVPEDPDVPLVPDEPEVPLIPEVPLVPEIPEVPLVPLSPDVPEVPE
jgi:hypothetical protein